VFSSCPKAGELSTLLVAESAFTRAVNSGQRRTEVFSCLLEKFLDLEYASGMVLTLKSWRDARPELLAEATRNALECWPLIRGDARVEHAHSGALSRWSISVPGAARSEECLSFCFSSSRKGAVALTGLAPIRAKAMLELRNIFSDAIEALLKRDGILASSGPGQPLLDMAECTWAGLDSATRLLADVENARGRAERLAAQASLLMRIRDLCQYAHIDKGLEEVASCLFAVTHRFYQNPMTPAHVDALRDILQSMRGIVLPVEDVHACLDRLDESGLSIYDVFGADDDGETQWERP